MLTVSWRITAVDSKPTDKDGFALMRVESLYIDDVKIELKLTRCMASCQDKDNIIHLFEYKDRNDNIFITAKLA